RVVNGLHRDMRGLLELLEKRFRVRPVVRDVDDDLRSGGRRRLSPAGGSQERGREGRREREPSHFSGSTVTSSKAITESALVQRPALPGSLCTVSRWRMTSFPSKVTTYSSPLAARLSVCQAPDETFPFQPANWRRSPFVTL